MHIDAHRMIRIARLRDSNEKAFKRIKSNFDLSKTYSHNIRTYEGKMFIAFVALIIVEAYRWYIRPELKAITSTTTATTIGELNKYQIQLKRDGSWMPMYAFTKKQRQLFSHLQLTEAKVRKEIDQLRLRV
jgi:transposase